MMDKPIYVGNARLIDKPDCQGMAIQIDLTQLGDAVRGDAAPFVTEWTDRAGRVHKQLKLVCWPLKAENVTRGRTHSVKIDTWVPPAGVGEEQERMPF